MKRAAVLATCWFACSGVQAAECTEADLLGAATADATQHVCKSPNGIVTNSPKTVGVYKQDGTFLCELSSTTQPVNVASVASAAVVACNSGLGLLAVKVGDRQFWIDRNDVTLNTDSEMVTCTEKAPAQKAPTPNVSMGAGENCKSAS